jgi:hypothetical protein
VNLGYAAKFLTTSLPLLSIQDSFILGRVPFGGAFGATRAGLSLQAHALAWGFTLYPSRKTSHVYSEEFFFETMIFYLRITGLTSQIHERFASKEKHRFKIFNIFFEAVWNFIKALIQ